MEMELKNIIEKIKQEGVEEAEKKSSAIVAEAEEKARKIVQEAQEKRNEILKDGRQQAEKFKKNAQDAVGQAVRDVLLSLRQKIIDLFDSVIYNQVSAVMSGDFLKEIIIKLVESFKEKGVMDIEVLLSQEDRDRVEESFLGSVSEEIKKGVEFQVSKNVERGFRIGVKGSNAYYDFTDEAVAGAFKEYLNPKVAQALDILQAKK